MCESSRLLNVLDIYSNFSSVIVINSDIPNMIDICSNFESVIERVDQILQYDYYLFTILKCVRHCLKLPKFYGH